MYFKEILHRGQKVKLQEGTITNFGFLMWEIQLQNGKIQTEARYRFDVVEEPPTNSPELDAYEELLTLFQNEINNKNYDHLTSPIPITTDSTITKAIHQYHQTH